MLNFLVLENKNFNYKNLFLDIDEKIYQISKTSLYNSKYGLTDKINYGLEEKLSNYKAILSWKLSNPSSFCNYSLKEIVSKIQFLLKGTKRIQNSLTGCTPENCQSIINFNINF